MKIKPLEGEIQLKIEEAKAGILNTSSRKSVVEYAQVIAVGEGVKEIKKGDYVFVKSWAIDIINHDEKDYFFISVKTMGVKAIVS